MLLVEPGGIAFIGDIDLSSFGPYYGDATSSLAAFRRTLEAVKDIPARVWITSHHKGVITERGDLPLTAGGVRGAARCARGGDRGLTAAAPRDARRTGGAALRLPEAPHDLYYDDAERRTIGQHLESLASAGRALEEGGRWRMASADML